MQLTFTYLIEGARHVTVASWVSLTLFVSWQEPVLRVMVIAGAMTTAGIAAAGTRFAGAQYLQTVLTLLIRFFKTLQTYDPK